LGLTQGSTPTNKTFVDAAYRLLFPGYTIQPSDENAFVPGLNATPPTLTRLQVSTVLATSYAFYFGFNGGSGVSIPNDGFVERAYQQYLNRPIDSGALNYYEMTFNSTGTFNDVSFLDSLFDSGEYLDETHLFP
jgi:hypothetical protein